MLKGGGRKIGKYFHPCCAVEARLSNFYKNIKTIRERGENWCVFGSSTLSTFVGLVLQESLVYFFDENPKRNNTIHIGKKVKKVFDNEGIDGIIIPFEGRMGSEQFNRFFSIVDILSLR